MSDTVEVAIRLSTELQNRVDALADALGQPTSRVIERAIESYVELASIKQALAEAEAGNFASDAEVEEFFARWQAQAPNAG